MPDSITEIEKAGLARNLKLKSINIPKNLTTLPEYCLMGSQELAELYIPDNIKAIGDKAFSLSGISKIRLPEGVGIEETILDGCRKLKSIVIGDKTVISLTELGKDLAFEGLHKSINKETGKEVWKIIYTDKEGNIHTQELNGVMSIQAKEKSESQKALPMQTAASITWKQIGQAFTKDFSSKPKEAMPAIETLENGVNTQGKTNEEQTQGEE